MILTSCRRWPRHWATSSGSSGPVQPRPLFVGPGALYRGAGRSGCDPGGGAPGRDDRHATPGCRPRSQSHDPGNHQPHPCAPGQRRRCRRHWGGSLAIFRALGDQAGEAETLNHYASVLGRQGAVEQAIRLLTAAQALAVQQGDRRLEGRILNNLGIYSSDPESRGGSCSATWRLAKRSAICPPKAWRATTWPNCYYGLAATARGIDHAEQALTLAENLNNPHDRADAIILRGQVWQAQGEMGQARAEILRGLGEVKKLGVPLSLMWSLYDLSRLLLAEYDWQSALANLEQSYRIWHELGEPYGPDFAAPFYAAQARVNLGLRLPRPRRAPWSTMPWPRWPPAIARGAWAGGRPQCRSTGALCHCAGGHRPRCGSGGRPQTSARTLRGGGGPLRPDVTRQLPGRRARMPRDPRRLERSRRPGGAGQRPGGPGQEAAARQAQLLVLYADAEQRGETLDEDTLAHIFGVAVRTIQRDLADLRDIGRLPAADC